MGDDGSEIDALHRELDRINGVLDRFSTGISHDLRNPLAAAAMACEVVSARAESLGADGRRAVDIIDRQLRRAAAIVDGLLLLARSSTSPQREAIAIRRIVEEAARDQELAITIGAMPATIDADRTAIAEAVKQLLRNAATHAHGAPVEIACVDAGETWELLVMDTGPGIAAEDTERIFDPMERGAASDGAGLGLTIVATIAEAHGGRAWVEQRAGGGAAFRLSVARR